MSDSKPKNILVHSEEWQNVRKSLLGKWKLKPDWCCSQLRKYLGNITAASKDKIKVVQNYLVGSFFRTNKNPVCAVNLRTQLSMEIKKRKAQKKW